MFDHILVDRVGAVGRIIFNRPEVLNAISPKTFYELKQGLAALEEDDEVRSILISGNGDSFSAGGDKKFLADMQDATAVEVKENVYKYFAGGVKAVKLCPKPT
ncbi:MAG: enoyl-CoA hydratase/isomerase family protein, partial [Alphaproteobacteria bacterium]